MLKDILLPRKKRALKKEMRNLKDDTEERLQQAEEERLAIVPKLELNLPAFKVCMEKLNVFQEKFDKRQAVLDELNAKKLVVKGHDDKALEKMRSRQKKRDAQSDVFDKVRQAVHAARQELAAKIAVVNEKSAVVEAGFQKTLDELAAQIAALRAQLAALLSAGEARERNAERLRELAASKADIEAQAQAARAELTQRDAAVPDLLQALQVAVDAVAKAVGAVGDVTAQVDDLNVRLTKVTPCLRVCTPASLPACVRACLLACLMENNSL